MVKISYTWEALEWELHNDTLDQDGGGSVSVYLVCSPHCIQVLEEVIHPHTD